MAGYLSFHEEENHVSQIFPMTMHANVLVDDDDDEGVW